MKRAFRFGVHDCCTAVAGCLREYTGENVLHIFDKYSTEEQADKLLADYGGVSGLAKSVASHYKLEQISILYATGGDVVVVKQPPNGEALGVVGLDGRFIYAAKRPCGWGRRPLQDAIVAYRIA